MRILITGVCGFVGSTLAKALKEHSGDSLALTGLDNFSRPGSETNRESLRYLGVRLHHGDLRAASDLESLGPVDWVVDAAANPSVLAGVDGRTSTRQLVEHNLGGTLNLLEFCKSQRAGFVLLSTSRVYSIPALAQLPVTARTGAFELDATADDAGGALPGGVSAEGVTERFSTAAPVSLYGATKLASEALALEYGEAFQLPVFINRCGVLAGAGQFGRADQGIFAYWINSYLRRRPLRYLGFGGLGHQVRDCLHPRDLATLLQRQLRAPDQPTASRILNVGGGRASARSLRQLSDWCATRFGAHPIHPDPTPRLYDLPWVVLDAGLAGQRWSWSPTLTTEAILEEIARHAEKHPQWLELSAS